MVELLQFSDELLVSIAYHVRYHPLGLSTAYDGLRQLSLTCRRLRRISQEILFQDVTILKERSNPNPTGLTALSLFLRSILEQEGLADQVKALQIEAVNVANQQFEKCIESEAAVHGRDCACGWTDLANSVEKFIQSIPSFRRLKLRRSSWWTKLAQGNQSMLVGILLRRVRALRALSLDIYVKDYRKSFRSQCIYRAALFGYLLLEPDFRLGATTGLVNITEFSSKNIVAPEFFELPKLEALQIGLDHDRAWTVDPQITLWHKPQGFQLSSTVKSLTAILNISDVSREADLGWKGKHLHLNLLIKSLVNLKHMCLRFSGPEEGTRHYVSSVVPGGSYAYIVPAIESSSIESLTLDTSQIDTDVKSGDGGFPNDYLIGIRPVLSLHHLPQLRQLTAPAAAFFSVNSLFATCPLPITIERIGIIDSMDSTNRYAQHLLQNRAQWPRLTEINLWQDAFVSPFAIDHRIVYNGKDEANAGHTENNNDADETWKLGFWVNDDVWEKLEATGVHVIKHREPRGWRRK